jgi:hypothetical protein
LKNLKFTVLGLEVSVLVLMIHVLVPSLNAGFVIQVYWVELPVIPRAQGKPSLHLFGVDKLVQTSAEIIVLCAATGTTDS